MGCCPSSEVGADHHYSNEKQPLLSERRTQAKSIETELTQPTSERYSWKDDSALDYPAQKSPTKLALVKPGERKRKESKTLSWKDQVDAAQEKLSEDSPLETNSTDNTPPNSGKVSTPSDSDVESFDNEEPTKQTPPQSQLHTNAKGSGENTSEKRLEETKRLEVKKLVRTNSRDERRKQQRDALKKQLRQKRRKSRELEHKIQDLRLSKEITVQALKQHMQEEQELEQKKEAKKKETETKELKKSPEGAKEIENEKEEKLEETKTEEITQGKELPGNEEENLEEKKLSEFEKKRQMLKDLQLGNKPKLLEELEKETVDEKRIRETERELEETELETQRIEQEIRALEAALQSEDSFFTDSDDELCSLDYDTADTNDDSGEESPLL